jgi:hypothetical protein
MTPLIAPGVDASPLMTWGDIEGTPMIIGAAPTPGMSILILSCMGGISALKLGLVCLFRQSACWTDQSLK